MISKIQQTYNYAFNINDIESTLQYIRKNISQNTNIPLQKIKFMKQRYGGSTTTREPIEIIIGTKSIYENINDNMVRDQDFVDTVLTCYHEQQHALRRQQFKQPIVDNLTKQIARIDLISTTIPEYYRTNTGYYDNIGEMDAELHGIIETRAFFKENFPEINVDHELVNIIHENSPWYADTHVKTVDEAIHNLHTAMTESYHKVIPLPINRKTGYQKKYSLKQFEKNSNNIQAYMSFTDGMQSNQYLLNFIKDTQPWRFYRYPCIRSEWPESALNGTAKPPVFAKTRHLDRGFEAEAKFGHIGASITSPDNDFSY